MLMMRFSITPSWVLMQRFGLGSEAIVLQSLIQTAQGRIWWAGHIGAADPYQGAINRRNFLRRIDHGLKELNCVTPGIAVSIAYDIALERRKKIIEVLISCNCPKLVAHIRDIDDPSKTWLHDFPQRSGFRLVKPQVLEEMKHMYCDVPSVLDFWEKVGFLFERDPVRTWNMKKTSIDSKRKFKV
jgi:hypothetical protein